MAQIILSHREKTAIYNVTMTLRKQQKRRTIKTESATNTACKDDNIFINIDVNGKWECVNKIRL